MATRAAAALWPDIPPPIAEEPPSGRSSIPLHSRHGFGRGHAVRRHLQTKSARLVHRTLPRLRALLPASRRAVSRPSLRPHAPHPPAGSRTRPFFRLPPPPHPRQLSVLHSFSVAHRHLWRIHPDALAHPHQSFPV